MWYRTTASRGVVALLFFALTTCQVPAVAPQRPAVAITSGDDAAGVIHVLLSDSVVTQLARDWTDYSVQPNLPERAYCLSKYAVLKQQDLETVVVVMAVTRARTFDKLTTPDYIVYDCGLVPSLHTHPPSTCVYAATGAWACQLLPSTDLRYCSPSGTDERSAASNWHRFDLIQCGEYRYVVFTGSTS